jgi:methionyl-tRNA formyltransferase
MLRCLFFGRDKFGLAAFRHLKDRGSHEVIGVVSPHLSDESLLLQKESYTLDIPFFQPGDVNEKQFLEEVRKLCPDINVSVNYPLIFGLELINLPEYSTINLHGGLCPNYRGGGGLYGAIINREEEFGITVHYMDGGIDTGPIVSQQQLPIYPSDNMDDLHQRMELAAPILLHRALDSIAAGTVISSPQADISGSYFPKKPLGDEIIDWSEPSQLIYDRIRARNPGPMNITYLGREKIVVKTASLTNYPNYIGTVGQVIGVEKEIGVVVKTGDNAIRIEQVAFGNDPAKYLVARFALGSTFLSNWRQLYIDISNDYERLLDRVEKLERNLNGIK